jgi:hypothetical protein
VTHEEQVSRLARGRCALRLDAGAPTAVPRLLTVWILVGMVVATLLAVPQPGFAARKSGVDRSSGLAVTLNGNVLTVAIRHARESTTKALYGYRIRAACAATVRPRANVVRASRDWPRGAQHLRFRFHRDISSEAAFCLLERRDGSDVAEVSFLSPTPPKLVARGRAAGEDWRLAVWTGSFTEPCIRLRLMGSQSQPFRPSCFRGLIKDDSAGSMGTVITAVECAGSTFVYGLASPEAAQVRVRLFDRHVLAAVIVNTARELSARPFWLVLPKSVEVRDVRAIDAGGEVLLRERYDRETVGLDSRCRGSHVRFGTWARSGEHSASHSSR